MDNLWAVVLLVSLIVSLGQANPLYFNEKSSPESDDNGIDILEQIENVNEKNDQILFEGDIFLDELNKDVDGPLGENVKRNAQRDRRRLWKSKAVPYVIQKDLTVANSDYRPTIKASMDEFHKHTCIKFVPRTNEKNWIYFVKEKGCWSSVGQSYWKSGGQKVSLGPGCNHKGVIMHELLHALGFWHEQSRPDRNQYVEVLWENIKPGKEHNFRKYSHGQIDNLKATYDYQSIMHYGSKAFNKNGQPTILAVGDPSKTLGQSKGFSNIDIFEINALYDCTGPSNGWSSWSDFGPCDNSCNKVRQRFCSSKNKAVDCPGADTYGIGKEEIKCPLKECNAPVDGHWGRWSSWSQCSTTCGQGTHTRTRQCDDPTPKNSGKLCQGNSSQTGICKLKRCGLGSDDCEFEIDMCIWTQDKNNNYRWHRQQGSTSSRSTGPDGDVTKLLKGKGYYVYAEASSPVKPKQKASLRSPTFPATSARCIQFSYNMYGNAVGSLNVYVINVNTGKETMIFTKSGNQGQQWYKANATISSKNSYNVSFEVIRGSSYTGDIALDDILFKDGKCGGQSGHTTAIPTTAAPTTSRSSTAAPTTSRPSTAAPTTRPSTAAPTRSRPSTAAPTTSRPSTAAPTTSRPSTVAPTTSRPSTAAPTTSAPSTSGPTTPVSDDCNFENGMCFWHQLDINNKYKWKRNTGGTSSSFTGPDGDDTKGLQGKGYYVYAEASPAKKGQVAKLQSKTFPATSARCIQFSYNMYGRTVGSLSVYVIDVNTGAKTLVFTKSGNQRRQWYKAQATIASANRFKISFEVRRGRSWYSDISLDDIIFKDGKCSVSDDCNFENGMCFWHQLDINNKYKWKRNTGGTSSSFTGPDGDDTKGLQGKGYYVYAEASPAKKGQVAKLQSKTFSATSARCIQFSYNMYGRTVGSLSVYVIDMNTGAKTLVFTKSGNQRRQWYKAQYTISSANRFKISFEVRRGRSWYSDISLDDIIFKDGQCSKQLTTSPSTLRPSTAAPSTSRPSTAAPTTFGPTVFSGDDCHFDQDMCNWYPGPGTNSRTWTRLSGRTPSSRTGPNGDHTSGSGSYVFVESSYPASIGQTATLVSLTFPPDPAGRCMSFYYHMYGVTMGTLNVYVKSPTTQAQSKLYTVSGDQKDKWHHGIVTISSICEYEVVFESVRGSGFRSDIALDDITFTDGVCPTKV